jgi:hypothetical protein
MELALDHRRSTHLTARRAPLVPPPTNIYDDRSRRRKRFPTSWCSALESNRLHKTMEPIGSLPLHTPITAARRASPREHGRQATPSKRSRTCRQMRNRHNSATAALPEAASLIH